MMNWLRLEQRLRDTLKEANEALSDKVGYPSEIAQYLVRIDHIIAHETRRGNELRQGFLASSDIEEKITDVEWS
jgi:hypothetical protein